MVVGSDCADRAPLAPAWPGPAGATACWPPPVRLPSPPNKAMTISSDDHAADPEPAGDQPEQHARAAAQPPPPKPKPLPALALDIVAGPASAEAHRLTPLAAALNRRAAAGCIRAAAAAKGRPTS